MLSSGFTNYKFNMGRSCIDSICVLANMQEHYDILEINAVILLNTREHYQCTNITSCWREKMT